MGKIFIIDLFKIIYLTEGSCEYVNNDHVYWTYQQLQGNGLENSYLILTWPEFKIRLLSIKSWKIKIWY